MSSKIILKAEDLDGYLTEKDQEYLNKCVPNSVRNRINELRGILLDINKNPHQDFTMK